jgi:8-oxo-dGTP diphosphatase
MLKNPFEIGTRKIIPAVLIYLSQGDRVLMIHRNLEKNERGEKDFHLGKWNGLGGKCELDESPLEAAKRELYEEAAIDLPEAQFKALGVLQFPNFKPHKSEDWIVYVFFAQTHSTCHLNNKFECKEGELQWVSKKDILSLNLWPGDLYFIPFVIKSQPFIGTIWYKEQNVHKHWIHAL